MLYGSEEVSQNAKRADKVLLICDDRKQEYWHCSILPLGAIAALDSIGVIGIINLDQSCDFLYIFLCF